MWEREHKVGASPRSMEDETRVFARLWLMCRAAMGQGADARRWYREVEQDAIGQNNADADVNETDRAG